MGEGVWQFKQKMKKEVKVGQRQENKASFKFYVLPDGKS